MVFLPFILLFSLIIIVNIILIYGWHQDNQHISKIEKEIEETIDPTIIEEEGTLINPPEEPEKESDYWYYVKLPFYDVDFTKLLQKNSDTVAFIHMNNTNVNYPIVQSSNNKYYLEHAFDKSKNDAGWVYLDYRNKNDFSDDNTIIYGHGRLNKTVFGSLKDALTKKWQSKKDNYAISISTPKKNLVYQIFSIYTIDAESYYITPSFKNAKEKETWLSTMKERNEAPIDIPVNSNDKVITLSTCLNNQGGRIVIQAKLIKEQT